MRVSHETIYRDLYDWRGGSLDRSSCRKLRTKRDRRKPSRLMPRRRSRFSGNVLMISDRPFAPTDRTKAGAWEGDLIMGRHNRSAIGTLVERTSRYTIVLPVDAAKRSESLRDSLIAAFADIPAQLRTSITWDQGWEMSLHEQITAKTGAHIYFCDPHSPWQRGTNEMRTTMPAVPYQAMDRDSQSVVKPLRDTRRPISLSRPHGGKHK